MEYRQFLCFGKCPSVRIYKLAHNSPMTLWGFWRLTPPLAALFLLDNRLEVYLWQREDPERMESLAPACSRWQSERRCAMEMVLQYCRGRMESEDVTRVSPVRAPQPHCHIFFLFYCVCVSRGKPSAPSAGLPPLWGGGASHFHQRVSPLGDEPSSQRTGTGGWWMHFLLQCFQSGSLMWLLFTTSCSGVCFSCNVTKAPFLIATSDSSKKKQCNHDKKAIRRSSGLR